MSNELDIILNRKLSQLFPDDALRLQVIDVLNTYGVEAHEQEPSRLHLAILKLGGESPTLDEIKKNTKNAKEDFRDILSWAEYPRQSKEWSIPDGSKKQKLVEQDLEEYRVWLNT